MSDTILARSFSVANADEQAKMINLMARELFVACGGKSKFEMQLCFMSDHIDADGRVFLNSLVEYTKLRKEKME